MAANRVKPPVQLIGPFEQLVLSAIAGIGKEAYGVPIHAKVSELMGKKVNMGSIYVTLMRMQDKGYIASDYGDMTPARRGMPKRFYRLEEKGIIALRDSFELTQRASQTASEWWRFGKWKLNRAK